MSAKRSVEAMKQIAEYMVKSNSFDRVTRKLQITDGGEGRCVAEFKIDKEHLNLHGGLHGGLTATIVDLVTTYALMSKPSHPGVSVDLQVMYIKAAKEGDELVVDANTIKADKQFAYIECELRQKIGGEVVAKGAQTKYVNFD